MHARSPCTADRVWNGITISNDGRAFASFSDADSPGGKPFRLQGGALPHKASRIYSLVDGTKKHS